MRRAFPKSFLWPFFLLCVLGLVLTWPGRYAPGPAPDARSTRLCQANLRRIGQAFAHYAQDFDGKFPRGVDPEDRAPQTWSRGYAGEYSDAAQRAPFLHEVLAPYLKDKTVWRCPADSGWTTRRAGFESRLGVVKPSSWQRFGTSYYYYTIHGFAGIRVGEIARPELDIVVFDGDFWHRNGWHDSLNALFADGHVENLPPEKFEKIGNLQWRILPPRAR